ncbi:hypothetical protein BDN72DRAFT_961472 [Pluteus cervinus]|uniref:Uncharacterized protein n=1 Tax=Pluteus cervinus TaxID=181527 RepID=A0ACD3AM75_9AGAR|nr:hypothetical protein BDN72DRAFT_961472 [Pluteus cervinus]
MNEDVIGIIAGLLKSDNDYHTLQNLSRVSRACRDPAQQQIFHDIHFNNIRSDTLAPSRLLPERLVSLRVILLSNPAISRYARSIHVVQRAIIEDGMEVRLSWIMQNARTLGLIMEELISSPIKEISLCTHSGEIFWKDLDEGFRDVFMRILRKSTLQNLNFASITLSPQFISYSNVPNLQQLRWVKPAISPDVETDDSNGIGTGSCIETGPAYPLTRLAIHPRYYEADTSLDITGIIIRSGLVLNAIRFLHSHFDSVQPHLPDLPHLKQVEELQMSFLDDFDTYDDQESWRVDLSEYGALRKLVLHHTFPGEMDSFLSWITNTLASIPSHHPNLQHIIIGLDFDLGSRRENWPLLRRLSDELSRLSQGSGGVLKGSEVSVYVCRIGATVNDPTGPTTEAIFEDVKSFLVWDTDGIDLEGGGISVHLRSREQSWDVIADDL